MVKYRIAHTISTENNKIFLSNENIDMILELLVEILLINSKKGV